MRTDNYKSEYRALINEYGEEPVIYALNRLRISDAEEIARFCEANRRAEQKRMERRLSQVDETTLRKSFSCGKKL